MAQPDLFSAPEVPAFETRQPRFSGAVYDPAADDARLTKQLGRVWSALQSGEWLTLSELAQKTHDPQASISAQLRHLRKPRFGGYVINKRRRGHQAAGCWEYRLAVRRVERSVCIGGTGRPVSDQHANSN